jgi:hypothetical protein
VLLIEKAHLKEETTIAIDGAIHEFADPRGLRDLLHPKLEGDN